MNTLPAKTDFHQTVIHFGDLPGGTRQWFNVTAMCAGFLPGLFTVSLTKADPEFSGHDVNFLARVTHLRNGSTCVYHALEPVGWVRDFRIDLAGGVYGRPVPVLSDHV